MHIVIMYGSTRKERQGIKAAKFVQKMVAARGHDVTLVEPFTYPLPMLDKTYKEFAPGTAPEPLERLANVLNDADGYLIVSGEYNHSIPGPLKNMIDHYMKEYFWKPSGIVGVSAGPFGGMRAAMTLRVVLPEVGMPTIPTLFPISKVQDSFDDEGNALDKAYEKRIQRFLDEFEWYVAALKEARAKGTPY